MLSSLVAALLLFHPTTAALAKDYPDDSDLFSFVTVS